MKLMLALFVVTLLAATPQGAVQVGAAVTVVKLMAADAAVWPAPQLLVTVAE